MAAHCFKLRPAFFEPIFSGQRDYHGRLEDPGIVPGDVIVFDEWTPKGLTGRTLTCQVLSKQRSRPYTIFTLDVIAR